MKKKTRKYAENELRESFTSNDELLEGLVTHGFKGLVKMTDEEITEELYSLGYDTIEEFEKFYNL